MAVCKLSGHERASLPRAADRTMTYTHMHRPIGAFGRALERRAAGRTLRATFRPQTGHALPRECPAHPRCSERNSESNIEEMTEEEVRGAGLEAGASGMAHLAKSTARRGIVFVQRATSSAPPVFEQRQLSGLNLLRPRSSPASVASKNHRASPGGIRNRITESGGAL